MRCFIGTHSQENIAHHGVVRELPVALGDLRSRSVRPDGKLTGIEIFEASRVGDHRLLFEKADEAMADTW